MYNPREGKLRRNKYFNLGYENTSTWQVRKALADCIEAYVDMGYFPFKDNSEKATAMLGQFTNGRIGRNMLRTLWAEAKEMDSAVTSLITDVLEYDDTEIRSAAEMLRLLNSGALKVETRIKKGKGELK